MNILIGIIIALISGIIVFTRIIEPTYILIFNKPIYVHFYPFPKKLKESQKELLRRDFKFYKEITPARKGFFEHRVHNFIDKYTFLGRNGIEVTDEMKLQIAATYIMLTFGMRQYLPTLFEAIIIYPDIFESRDGNYHKGEFNPAFRAVVFSWKHFQEGFEFDNDNLNLGLHEFAHVLHFDAVSKRRPGSSAIIYSDMFDNIMKYIDDAKNREMIAKLNYFRLYAYTNQYEFIAVILEYFFETPREFKQKLPELYEMVKRMINFKENRPGIE